MVILRPDNRPEVHVPVELARTDYDRARGLMYRDRLAPDAGMLFLFEREEAQTFWMKNTYLPLDMVFITKEKRVLGVVENAVPLTESPRNVPGSSQFVLEVNAGFCRKYGIGPGTKVELSHVE